MSMLKPSSPAEWGAYWDSYFPPAKPPAPVPVHPSVAHNSKAWAAYAASRKAVSKGAAS